MKSDIITQLQKKFKDHAHQIENEEFWFASDLLRLLGYSKQENFARAIEKAKMACLAAGHAVADHFPDIRKMVDIGSRMERQIEDIALTRYACYLIAQNGDPRKVEIAFAQSYFALQTPRIELLEKRLIEQERLVALQILTLAEKELSGLIFECTDDNSGFARIRNKGIAAMYDNKSTD